MSKRFVFIWFRHLLTDWQVRKHPELGTVPFAFTLPSKGREVIIACNEICERSGVYVGMALPDARTMEPFIQRIEGKDKLSDQLLDALAGYCMRYSPNITVMAPEGLGLDVTGCAHLWGGEAAYLKHIVTSLRSLGYDVRAAMADTIGAAWAVSRYGVERPIIQSGTQKDALALLPPAALRLDEAITQRLKRLGLKKICQLYNIPRGHLVRRFGETIALRLSQALGEIPENLVYKPFHEPFVENLMTPEGVATAEGIAAALSNLLEQTCQRLQNEHKGVRYLVFDCFRVDGDVQTVEVGTSKPSQNPVHLFRLFSDKLDKIEPALGIEQFRLTASQTEKVDKVQDSLLNDRSGMDETEVKEMVDRLSNRFDPTQVYCFRPLERHWPENSIKAVPFADVPKEAEWRKNPLRPVTLLKRPEPIEVTALLPDYPPVFFKHKNNMHLVSKADGPERIEQEWWIKGGPPRDYFKLEDEQGQRFWVFRDGQYSSDKPPSWYLHGYFA